MIITIIILVVLVILIATIYNGAVTRRQAVVATHKNIGVQLDARGKVIDSLVSISKKYELHEKEIFTKLAELRAQSQGLANTDPERVEIEKEIDKVVQDKSFNIAFENYPNLELAGIMQKNQEAIISEENKLRFAKRAYNNSIETFTIYLEQFPNNIIINIFGAQFKRTLADYPYWDISEEQKQVEEAKRMSFD